MISIHSLRRLWFTGKPWGGGNRCHNTWGIKNQTRDKKYYHKRQKFQTNIVSHYKKKTRKKNPAHNTSSWGGGGEADRPKKGLMGILATVCCWARFDEK